MLLALLAFVGVGLAGLTRSVDIVFVKGVNGK